MADGDDILSDQQAAELLKVTRIIVRKLARRGEIPCQRLGEAYRFSRAALIEWLAYGNDAALGKPLRSRTAPSTPAHLPPVRPLLRLRSEGRTARDRQPAAGGRR
jgi:excisionase family DNA binding protein